MKVAERMSRLGTENAFEVLAEVKKLEAAGREIVSFAIGEPDFNTPEHIKEAAIQALRNNQTHYGPSAGILPLRETIANHVSITRGIPVHPDEVVVTSGAKPIMFYIIQALVDPGDEVIYPNPGFPIYESLIRFVGGVPVPAPLLEAKDFRFDVDHLSTLVTNKTKLIILNSPQNPTGGVLTEADLTEVSRLAIEHDLWVLTDEIYSRIIYNGTFHSIASIPGMKERTIILDGFSKTYAMTGWRLGYGVMNRGLADLTARLVTNSNSCTTTFVQHGGLAALTGSQDFVHEMVEEFRARRDMMVSALRNMRGVTCREPSGAFYVFPNVTEACRNLGFTTAKELQQHLLHEGVAVLPRTAFGSKNEGEQEEYVRLSYATSRENIRKGLQLMKQVLEQ